MSQWSETSEIISLNGGRERGPNIIFTSSLTSPSCETPSGIDSQRRSQQLELAQYWLVCTYYCIVVYLTDHHHSTFYFLAFSALDKVWKFLEGEFSFEAQDVDFSQAAAVKEL